MIYTYYIIDTDPMLYPGYVTVWLVVDNTAHYVAN